MREMEKIIETFELEFNSISDKFEIIEENVRNLPNSKKEFIHNPGVYVFFNNNGIIKVGRHLKNSRKRAYEHIIANTKNNSIEMKNLPDFPDSKVLLLNVKNKNDIHWVAAVEIFLEIQLKPLIRTKRL